MTSQKRKPNSILPAAGLMLLFFLQSVASADEGIAPPLGHDFSMSVVRGQLGTSFMPAPEKKSSLSSSVKGGFDKMAGMFSSKKDVKAPPPAKDELSLSNRPEPSVKLHTSLARVYESQGRLGAAEAQFRAAIKLESKSRLALLEYARFLDRREQFDAAIGLYRHAEKVLRNDPAVQNDLGLCYARHDRCEQAITAFKKAVAIAPKNVLYRNNLAMVLVELGQEDEAMEHLLAVNGRAVAEYNMGYLLFKKGKTDSARRHFQAAAKYNSHMKEASWWVASLNAKSPPHANHPVAAEPRVERPVQQRTPVHHRPEYTANRPRADRPKAATIWARSTEPVPSPSNDHRSPAVERLPMLRQPQTVIPFRDSAQPSLSSPMGKQQAPPIPGKTNPVEPLPPIRR